MAWGPVENWLEKGWSFPRVAGTMLSAIATVGFFVTYASQPHHPGAVWWVVGGLVVVALWLALEMVRWRWRHNRLEARLAQGPQATALQPPQLRLGNARWEKVDYGGRWTDENNDHVSTQDDFVIRVWNDSPVDADGVRVLLTKVDPPDSATKDLPFQLGWHAVARTEASARQFDSCQHFRLCSDLRSPHREKPPHRRDNYSVARTHWSPCERPDRARRARSDAGRGTARPQVG